MAMFRAREVLPTQLELLKRQTREGAIIFFFLKGDGTEGERPMTKP